MTRKLKAARLVSDVFNPQWVGVPLFLVVGYRATESLYQALLWWAVCMGLLVVPGRLYLLRGVRQKRFSDHEVSERSQRTPFYLVALGLLGFAVVVMLVFHAPAMLVASLVGMAVAGVLGFLVNFKWKISVHSGGIGASATLLALLFGPLSLLIMLPIVAAVGWSRVALRQHTPGQVVAGVVVCSATIALVFRLFGLA